MNWRFAFFFLLIAFIVINCSKTTTSDLAETISRTMQPSQISAFHPEISLQVGWVPYQNQKLVQTGKNGWKIVKHQEGDGVGKVPVIMVAYPDSKDTILLDMNIKNELLGKLVKHSAITQVPIQRPFTTFFEEAKCQKCHPENVEVDFDR